MSDTVYKDFKTGFTFGDLVRIARQNMGVSLAKMGDDLDISASYISRIENNQKDERGAIAFPIVMRLAMYLHISFSDVLKSFGIDNKEASMEQSINLNLPGMDKEQTQALINMVLAMVDEKTSPLYVVEETIKTIKLFKGDKE